MCLLCGSIGGSRNWGKVRSINTTTWSCGAAICLYVWPLVNQVHLNILLVLVRTTLFDLCFHNHVLESHYLIYVFTKPSLCVCPELVNQGPLEYTTHYCMLFVNAQNTKIT